MIDNITALAEAREEKAEKKAQRDQIIELVIASGIELFRSTEKDAFAYCPIGGHYEIYPVRSQDFRRLLNNLFYIESGKAPSAQARAEAIDTLESMALYQGSVHPVGLRFAELNGALYLDLANDRWQVIEVRPEGWRVVDASPVRFRRAKGMLPLPEPQLGGSLSDLARFLNCQDDESLALIIIWCLAAMRTDFPVPLLVLQGEAGSAKSTTARILQSLVDPCSPALRAVPRNEQDLIIAARNRRVLSFDNLSVVAGWLSDALCRLVTDGGFGTRELFSDWEEVTFEGRRAMILTGIDDLVRRHDLADRALVLNLRPISEETRRGEDFHQLFERKKPQVLWPLLDALSAGFRERPNVRLTRLPRMAGFALWGTACERAIGLREGGFMLAYAGNRSESLAQSMEGDPVALAVRDFFDALKSQVWEGSPTDCLNKLDEQVPQQVRDSREWPKVPQALSSRLKRAASALRSFGIQVEFDRSGQGRGRRRVVRFRKLPQDVDRIDPSPGPAANSVTRGAVEAVPARTITGQLKPQAADPDSIEPGAPDDWDGPDDRPGLFPRDSDE